MATETLNIVREMSRADAIELEPYAKDAQYAQLSHDDKIQMFYRKIPIKYNDNTVEDRWQYLSFAKLWMGASDNMTTKRLIKIVD